MIAWIGIIAAAAFLLVTIVTGARAWSIEARVRRREVVADLDTDGIRPDEWRTARRLKRIALTTLVLAIFTAVCTWALFGSAIMDQMA